MLKLADKTLLRADAYVNGAWTTSRSGERFAVTNPATGKTIAEVSDLDEVDTRAAIKAAHEAQPTWRAKTAKERAGSCANGSTSSWRTRKTSRN